MHASLEHGRSQAILTKLIEIGGRELVMQKDGYGNTALQVVLKNDDAYDQEVQIEVVSMLIEIGGREIVMERDKMGDTALHACAMSKVPIEIISKILDIGGCEIALARDNEDDTALHYACIKEAPIEVISKIINIGGYEVVTIENESGSTVLHYACTTLFSAEVIMKFIETGGEELVMHKNEDEYTALHKLFLRNDDNHANGSAALEVLSKLIEVGGRNLVMEKNGDGDTALHLACRHNFPIELVSRLIDIGGRELIMETNNFEDTPLHDACKNELSQFDAISQLINIGGQAIVNERNNDGLHALHCFYTHRHHEEHITFGDAFMLILQAGITAEIGGEFGIGGLFNVLPSNDDEVQKKVYDEWENLASSLEKVVATPQWRQSPLLHAAIVAKAPRHVIIDITNRFQCVLMKDSLNRYPIDVAVQQGLEWNGGMQELMEATASAQQRPIIFLAAQYGLKWRNHMSEIVDSHLKEEMKKDIDEVTGLHLFMLAAMGNNSDLSSIYGIMRKCPYLSSMFWSSNE